MAFLRAEHERQRQDDRYVNKGHIRCLLRYNPSTFQRTQVPEVQLHMQFIENASPPDPAPRSQRDFHLLIEPEPWLRVFLRNSVDLFRPGPPQVRLTSKSGEYWADALVNRPVA